MNNFLILFLCLLIFSDSIFGSLTNVGEVTVYQQDCIGGQNDDIHKCKETGGSSRILEKRYKIDFNNQRVTELSPWVKTYQCNVFDKNNWNCEIQSMRDGYLTSRYDTESVNGELIFHNRPVPVTWYWFQCLKDLFGIS